MTNLEASIWKALENAYASGGNDTVKFENGEYAYVASAQSLKENFSEEELRRMDWRSYARRVCEDLNFADEFAGDANFQVESIQEIAAGD